MEAGLFGLGYGGTLGYRASMCLGFFGSISDIGMA